MSARNLARSVVLNTASVLHLNELRMRWHRGRPEIVIVEMHETPGAYAEQLRSQLEWVSKNFAFITPELFVRAFETRSRTWAGSKPAVLFTFDDGRESNYRVAAPVLESFGARGIFFVVPQFIGLEGNAAKEFYYSRIDTRQIARPANGSDDEIWKPMNAVQVADLARRGHWIGSHTTSHTRLAGISPSQLEQEIRESAVQITRWTGKPTDTFAWAYGWDEIDRDSWHAIRQLYGCCFTPCPGTVDPASDSSFLIWRKEIESYYSAAEYQFMYSGLVDCFWSGKRTKLRKMLR